MVKFQVVRFTKYHTLFQICLYPYPLLFSLQPTYDAPNTVEPRYFEVPREMEKKFEIAGFRNNRGSVKGKGKSKGIRSSFEIAGTSN